MRRLTLGAACAMLMLDSASAQNNQPGGGTTMPGQVVGGYSGTLNQVGQKAPPAAPNAGFPITSNPMIRPYDPNNPYAAFKGTNIDPKMVLAPVSGPDGLPVNPPNAFDKLTAQLKALFGVVQAPPSRPPYAPGIGRRNRERNDHMWRRD